MDVDAFDWDDPDDPGGNTRHVAEHGVTPEEFEEVVLAPASRPAVSRSTDRPMRFGWTSTGKHLAAVFEVGTDGVYTVVRPITAFEVDP